MQKVLAFVFCLVCHSALAVNVGDQTPAWQGEDLITGEQLAYPALLKDKPAVLVFWATWCPYCKAFMPYLENIEADYRDRGVRIVTFNSKERGIGDPEAYAKTLGFPLIAVRAADQIGEAYGIDFIPGLLIVDGEGKVIYRRRSTDLPAGRTVSEQWDHEVRAVLDRIGQ